MSTIDIRTFVRDSWSQTMLTPKKKWFSLTVCTTLLNFDHTFLSALSYVTFWAFISPTISQRTLHYIRLQQPSKLSHNFCFYSSSIYSIISNRIRLNTCINEFYGNYKLIISTNTTYNFLYYCIWLKWIQYESLMRYKGHNDSWA